MTATFFTEFVILAGVVGAILGFLLISVISSIKNQRIPAIIGKKFEIFGLKVWNFST